VALGAERPQGTSQRCARPCRPSQRLGVIRSCRGGIVGERVGTPHCPHRRGRIPCPTRFLEERGCLVLEATTAEQAIAVCRSDTQVDVLFTDINLNGGGSGWEVAERFRAARPNITVFYTSGNSIDRSRCVPDSLVFSKPYVCPTFWMHVGACLEVDSVSSCVTKSVRGHSRRFANVTSTSMPSARHLRSSRTKPKRNFKDQKHARW
jgi:CheY-like chemotaxis protein